MDYLSNINLSGGARITGVPTPINPSDALPFSSINAIGNWKQNPVITFSSNTTYNLDISSTESFHSFILNCTATTLPVLTINHTPSQLNGKPKMVYFSTTSTCNRFNLQVGSNLVRTSENGIVSNTIVLLESIGRSGLWFVAIPSAIAAVQTFGAVPTAPGFFRVKPATNYETQPILARNDVGGPTPGEFSFVVPSPGFWQITSGHSGYSAKSSIDIIIGVQLLENNVIIESNSIAVYLTHLINIWATLPDIDWKPVYMLPERTYKIKTYNVNVISSDYTGASINSIVGLEVR